MNNIYKTKWKQKSSAASINASALRLAKLILNADGILLQHKKEFLNYTIWKVTEANGRRNTRFVSKGVWKGNKPIEHEHVIPRKELVRLMLKNPKKVKKILESSLGCLVTKKEHGLLTRKGTGNGWSRYRSVRIKVYDRLKEKWVQ